jgi:hypothetical protein
MSSRWAFLVAALSLPGYVHAATISFTPPARGERWPRVELRRDQKDPKGELSGRVTLRQATNPQRRFSPYLAPKEVGVLALPAGRASSLVALTQVLRVPLSSLAPGRYELEVELRGPGGEVVGRGAASLDEAVIEAMVAPQPRGARGAAAVSAEAGEGEGASGEVDAKLVVLDPRELASLPSEEARKSARVFAVVLASRDAETFRQMVPQNGLKTDKGTVPHPELERQLAGGMDALVGPPPRAPWHVAFDRNAPDRFTMRPSPRASQSVTFERGADGHWRVGQVTKKKSAEGE